MDHSQIQEKYAPIFRKFWIPIILGVYGLAFLSYGLIASITHKPAQQDILSDGANDKQPVSVASSSASRGANSNTNGAMVAGDSINSLININSATEEELDSLPGFGVVTAGKMINNRPYGSVDEMFPKKW